MNLIEGGVTAPKGFLAAAGAAGIKYEGRDDLALLVSKEPCESAGTFTSNVVKAAPVLWDRRIIREGNGPVRAVVVNSGIANACTGAEGMEICEKTAEAASEALGISPEEVLTASTGVIGMQIPVDKITAGIRALAPALKDTPEAGTAAAKAIMTTDTVRKEIAAKTVIGGKEVTIGAMTKGSGMIHPNMCTMLCFITTDAAISKEMLQKALSADVEETYNMISVDGDTSTNDTCVLLANGLAGNPVITAEGEDFDAFCEALRAVNTYLAKKMAGDGEGAEALFEMKVTGASAKAQAKTIARSVVSSSLVKTAIAGHDANWGRILCAMGYSGAEFDPEKVSLWFESAAGRVQIAKGGRAVSYSEEEATKILSEKEVTATADLGEGKESAAAWGCDLTYEYIRINADYRS